MPGVLSAWNRRMDVRWMEGRGLSAQDAADIVGADTGTTVVDLDLEPHLPDRLQVVGEPLGELLDGVHVAWHLHDVLARLQESFPNLIENVVAQILGGLDTQLFERILDQGDR